MARVPKVARETIPCGMPSLRNLPRNSGWILYFQKIAIKFRQWSCTKFQISPLWKHNIAKLTQNIPKATISFHTIYCVKTDGSGYPQLAGSPIYWYVNSLYSRWKFDEHGIHACKWNIFMRMTTAKLISEQYFGMKNSNSTHGKNIVHCSGPDMVKSTIVQYVFRTLTLWNSLFRYCHEWLRPDLKIRFSNSSNMHGTGKAAEIFTEI